MSMITSEDPKVRKILSMWPSIERWNRTKNPNMRCGREICLDVLTHLARCAFLQQQEVSEYDLQEGLAGAIRSAAIAQMHLGQIMQQRIAYYPGDDRTGLQLAFLLKDIEIAKAAIDVLHQIHSTWSPRLGPHPMMIACSEIYADRGGDLCAKMDMAKTIGWSPNFKDKKGNTALHLCASNPGVELDQFQQVLDYYAKQECLDAVFHQENTNGHTPLSCALYGDDGVYDSTISKMQLMMDRGAGPKRPSTISGRNLLTELVGLVGIYPDGPDESSQKTIQLYQPLLQRMFSMGMTLQDPDADGVSALDLCVHNQVFRSRVSAIFMEGQIASNPQETKSIALL